MFLFTLPDNDGRHRFTAGTEFRETVGHRFVTIAFVADTDDGRFQPGAGSARRLRVTPADSN
jgi:hypothetical protein